MNTHPLTKFADKLLAISSAGNEGQFSLFETKRIAGPVRFVLLASFLAGRHALFPHLAQVQMENKPIICERKSSPDSDEN